MSLADEKRADLPPVSAPMDVRAILRILPHRYPFLLVDRVVDVVPGERLTALKSVTFNEPFFQGHFPGLPVMPGVLIVESMAQAAALLAYASHPFDASDQVIYLTGLDGVRFRRPVVPGDRLQIEVEVVRQKASVWKERARALVDGALAAEAELLATIAPRAG